MKKQLLFKTPIRGISGYATYARKQVKAFADKYGDEYEIQIQTYPWQEYDIPMSSLEEDFICQHEKTVINRSDAVLINWTLPHEFQPDCKYNIGYTLFETDRLPDMWVPFCNKMNEMWSPSTYNKTTFRNSGVAVPIHIVPGGVDSFYFRNVKPLQLPKIDTTYNFITGGQWTPIKDDRKNITRVIEGFLKAFKGNTNVGLVAKVYCYNNNSMDLDYIKDRIEAIKKNLGVGRYPRVYLVHGMLSETDLLRLYHTVDCAVLPSPEGWGMWHIQCAAAGLPVIGMDWSAYTDFLSPDLTPFIEHQRMVHVPKDMECREPYRGTHYWPEITVEEISNKMTEVYSNKDGWKVKAILQKDNLYNGWRWEHSSDKMYNRLEEIHSETIHPKTIVPVCNGEKKIPTYIITSCHGNLKSLPAFIKSIEFHRNKLPEDIKGVYIISNGGKDSGTHKYVTNLAEVDEFYSSVIIKHDTLSFSKATNIALEYLWKNMGSTEGNVLFMDSNTSIPDDKFIQVMSNYLNSSDEYGAVTCKILNVDGTVFSAGARITTNTYNVVWLGNGERDDGQYNNIKETGVIGGTCMMWKSSVLKEIGGFTDLYFLSYKNIDLCLKARSRGYKFLCIGSTKVVNDINTVFSDPDFDLVKAYEDGKKSFVSMWKNYIDGSDYLNNV